MTEPSNKRDAESNSQRFGDALSDWLVERPPFWLEGSADDRTSSYLSAF